MDENEKGAEVEMQPDAESDIEEHEDGSATVTLDEPDLAQNAEFYANLAEDMPTTDMMMISSQLLEFIERDKEARSLRDKQYEEGLRRTGLGDDAPGGADFQGASKVVHPMLTEACIDFSSRVIKELFPANGPVKEFIPGEVTQAKLEKAKRKQKFMNWQLTQQMVEFRPELEQLTTQVPLGGAQYLKMVWDEQRNRPRAIFVPIDDVYLPYSATSFYTAERKTHVQYVTRLEFEKRVGTGMYRDINLVAPQEPDLTGPQKANNKIEGREQTSYNEDGLRTVFEIACFLDFEDNFGLAPYLVTVDHTTKEVLSIYRNWDPDDEQQEELVHMIEFPFVPWRGAYPIGLPHMIGSLSAAATGALRALLDSAHINNFPGMLKLKGGSRGGQSDRIEPILTDYESLVEFIPNLTKSSLIEHPEGGIRLEQIGSQCLLNFKFCARVVLDLEEIFPKLIKFAMVEGDFKGFSGFWRLEPYKLETGEGTDLCYTIRVWPKLTMPIGIIENRLANDLRSNLLAIRQRASW